MRPIIVVVGARPNFMKMAPLYSELKKRNLNIEKSKSSVIFDKGTKAGENIKLKSKDKCYCIFAAPGSEMMVHEQNPSTELTVTIKRSIIKEDKEAAGHVLYHAAESLRVAAIMLSPVMPEKSEEIMIALGATESKLDWAGLKPGNKISKGDPIFPRIIQ